MKVGFVIVNYNDYQTTQKIIDNIKNYKIIEEIIIVDNHSTDDSYKQLQKLKCDKIHIESSNKNLGYSGGLNIGCKYLINKYRDLFIIISNSDIVINQEKDILKLVKEFAQHPSAGVVAPIIKEHTGLNRGWRIPTPFQDTLLNIVGIHRKLRPKLLYYNDNYYRDVVPVETVSGCFFIIKSDVLKDIDYFDENVFLYYEENILGIKLKQKNYQVLIDSSISVFHNHSVTIDKNVTALKKYKILKQSQMYFQKRYNRANLLQILSLWLTNKLSYLILSIVYLYKSRKK